MSKNKGYNNQESFVAEPIVVDEAPIEEAPIAKEEVKEEIKEIPEVRQEVKFTPKVKESKPSNQKAKVILITRDGCIVETLGQNKTNISLYGKDYLNKTLGDIIEL